MSREERERIEREARCLAQQGDLAGASTAAIRGLGPELYGFLVGFHRSEQDASEVFSIVTERLWRGLPTFDWACSLRTWAYTIARNASITHQEEAARRAREHVPLSQVPELSQLIEQVRSETAAHLKTETKSRVAALRASLTVDERMLLSLRVDRELDWNELVRVLHDGGEPLEGEALRREAAKMRKRFQALKEKLGELARREGLLGKAR
ncbi:MAG: sigma-70 family RNA polymerase sigma factor [Minicystis sp.]